MGIIGGEDRLIHECNIDPRCVAYQYSSEWSMGYRCNKNDPMILDKIGDHKVCIKAPVRGKRSASRDRCGACPWEKTFVRCMSCMRKGGCSNTDRCWLLF